MNSKIKNFKEFIKFFVYKAKRAYTFLPYFLVLFCLFFASIVQAQTTQTFVTTGIWTCPSGVTSVTVESWGAGGAGGGVSSGTSGGGGGGGGAYTKAINVSVTAGTTYNITVGAGGAGNFAKGTDGGDSYFDTNTSYANGGNGGVANNGAAGIGGATGTGTSYKGGDGFKGKSGTPGGGGSSAGTGANGNTSTNATGGGQVTGGGAGGNGGATVGGNGSFPGGGGGGAKKTSSGTSANGGNGGDGQVIITWIGNNQLDYTNGSHGTACANVGENGSASFATPAGTVITTVNFASYGSPTGSCGSFSVNPACNAINSQAIVESYVLGNNSATIPATNGVFTDPCYGTLKQLDVQATYTQPICSGTSPGTISGTTPTGGAGSYTYFWEVSTTGATSGFSPAPGINNTKDYIAPALTQTSWYRRTVTSGCSNTSPVIIVPVLSLPTKPIASVTAQPTCSVTTGTITITAPTGTGMTYSTDGTNYTNTTGIFSGMGAGSYNLTAKNSGGCISTITAVTVNATPPSPAKPTASVSTQPTCSVSTGTITITAPTGAGMNYSTDGTTYTNTTGSFSGMVSGNYNLTARNSSGCISAITAVTVNAQPATPTVSFTTTPTCVGGSSGTISASASGGQTPYTYSLNGGSYQTSNLFTGLAAATYTLNVKSNQGCIGSISVTVSAYANSTGDQSAMGNNAWIGHTYSGMNFGNYIGYYNTTESFDEGFGGDLTCFSVTSNSGSSSIYTENFSVRYKMKSSKNGLYVVDLGSDDGSRLTVDGALIYNNWSDQGFSTRARVLMNLTGSSLLNYEFYENAGGNRVIFNNLTLVLANTLSTNLSQNICQGNTAVAIAGDTYGILPSGVSLSGTGYQWSYSLTPTGSRTNISGATADTYSPNTSVAPFNTPGTYYIYRNATLSSSNNINVSPYVATNESNAAVLTVNSSPSSTISYTGSPFCVSGSISPTLTGTTGGKFSSTTGLSINATTGAINLSASTAGTYTVTYTIAASAPCSIYTTTTSVVINGNVAIPVFALGASSIRCQTGESITYSATATNSTGITYSLDAASISGGNTINSSTGSVTYQSTWTGTSTITATAAGCTGPKTAVHTVSSASPTIVPTTTPTCVGGASGTITLSASGGQSPFTYSLNGGGYQSGNSFGSLAAATYTVAVKSNTGCVSSLSVTVSPYANSTGDQTVMGNNAWIGHTYSGMNFDNYIGYYNTTENFDEGFGGDYNCFSVTSSSGTSSIYTEKFSVRYKMKSSKRGLYVVDLGSDDGSRLYVDAALVYNNWSDQSFSTRPRILMNLTGTSLLNYEFYENGGNNRTIFNNLTLVLANILSTNVNQNICVGTAGVAISGDAFGTLPAGILAFGTGYQWSYSTTLGGTRYDISGATAATFIPDASSGIFNSPGTYYIYRNAKLSSSNNTNVNPYVTSNESNVAVITVNAAPTAVISYSGSPFCNTILTGQSGTITGTPGGTFSATPAGLSINATSGSIIPGSSTIGTYTVLYSINPAGGCSSFSTSVNIYVGQPGTWFGTIDTQWLNPGNWICGQIPNSTVNVTIPKNAPNFPTVITNLATVKDIIIQKDASVVINGTLKIAGNIYNSGILDASNGTLEMNGSVSQTIAGSMFDKKIVNNLVVSNSGSGLSVSAAANDTLKITGALTFGTTTSKLNTGDNINLVSTIAATANVGIVNPGNTITGKVIVDRFISSGINHEKSWQLLSVPTNSQTIKESWMENGVPTSTPTGYGTWLTGVTGTAGGFDAASASPSMKTYVPANDTWVTVGNPSTTPIHNDNGYLVFVRGDRSVFNLSGPNSTAQPTNLRSKGNLLTGTMPVINIPAGKYQSVGNPYASRLDFSKISLVNVDKVFYVWDPLLYGYYGYGGYQTLAAANGYQPTAGGTSNYQVGTSYPYIESGEAFFVHNSTGTNGAVTFTENAKATGSRIVNRANSTLSQRQFFRVYMYTGAGAIADGNAVAFDNDFSNAVDDEDAIKILNTGENFGLRREGAILAVEARSPVENADTIYYNIGRVGLQTYLLHFAPENMRGSGLNAFLVDNYLKTSKEISLDEESDVPLTITTDAGSYAFDRLMVVFKVMAPLPVTFTSIKATQKNADILVEWKVENESNIQQYAVEKSVDGNSFSKVATLKAINGAANNYNWLDQNAVSGYNYYRIRSIGINGQQNYTSVVKVLIGKSISEMSVYPNPVVNGSINLLLSNQPAGVYEARLLNGIGQVIISKTIHHTEGSSTEILKINNNFSKGIYQLEIIKPDGDKKIIKVVN